MQSVNRVYEVEIESCDEDGCWFKHDTVFVAGDDLLSVIDKALARATRDFDWVKEEKDVEMKMPELRVRDARISIDAEVVF